MLLPKLIHYINDHGRRGGAVNGRFGIISI